MKKYTFITLQAKYLFHYGNERTVDISSSQIYKLHPANLIQVFHFSESRDHRPQTAVNSTGFLPFKKHIIKDDMQISHVTHLQMLFEQHLQTINDYVIPAPDILERTQKGRQRERARLVSSSSSFHAMPDKAADSSFLRLTADPLRSGTQMI